METLAWLPEKRAATSILENMGVHFKRNLEVSLIIMSAAPFFWPNFRAAVENYALIVKLFLSKSSPPYFR